MKATLTDEIALALDDLLGPDSDIDHDALAVELADTAWRWFQRAAAGAYSNRGAEG